MIKWAGYGKLLKQLFSIGLISCFILLGGSFVNAFDLSKDLYVRENGTYGVSPYDNIYDIQVFNKGNLITQKVGLSLRGIYLRDGTYMVWKYSDYLGGIAPFLSYKGSGDSVSSKVVNQGFPTYYAVCDKFGSGLDITFDLSGCSVSYLNSQSLPFISSFMSGVSITDFYGFNYQYWNYSESYYDKAGVLFCFSSEFFNKSMCFGITKYTRGTDYIYPGFEVNSSSPYMLSGYGVSLPANFDNLYSKDLSMSPGQSFVDGGGGAVENPNNTPIITGNYTYSTCTNGQIVSALESHGYNKYMCYGGIDDFSNYQTGVNYIPIIGSGATLPRILKFDDDFSDYSAWFDYFNNLYKRTINSDNVSYLNKWTQYPAVYKTWFDIFYQFGGNGFLGSINDLNQYCILVVNNDYSSTYTGSYFSSSCKGIINSNNYGNGGNGENIDGVNWGDNTKTQGNAVQFIQDFFNKAQEVIPTNYSDLGLGSLPVYIITFFCALIFFRFLMHK